MSEAESAAEESGKEVKEKGLLYFRKPDVNHTDGFKLSTEVPVTFRVYVDDKEAWQNSLRHLATAWLEVRQTVVKRRAAPVKSQFWQKKVESEGLPAQVRKKMSEAESAAEESGKEALYLDQVPKTVTPVEVKEKGFKLSTEVPVTFRVYVDDKGKLRPDCAWKGHQVWMWINEGLPAQVRKKMSEAESAAEESGKEVKEKGLLYFRKPDVNHTDGFKLSTEVPVTFRVYVDDKGAGAMDVSMA
ncbi:unnamed protein product [Effrenium voratum]|nr:unnamed protein product [Effrenium voratum]